MSSEDKSGPCTKHSGEGLIALAIGALGVVYGDIGTSPLYAFRECFSGAHGLSPTPDNVMGVASLFFWSLVMVVTVKYLLFLMTADNKGEGGILALMTLVSRGAQSKAHTVLLMIGLFGAALLYGDGIITPAISVLSAVEGLNVATNIFEPYVIYISLSVLAALFLVQRFGTAKVGAVFGPIILLWFITIGVLGVMAIAEEPQVLTAVNPAYAARLFLLNKGLGFLVLGSVFLCVTGGEVLYADMGHFGKAPIRLGWFAAAFPGVLLSYLGQAAYLIGHPGEVENLFYRIVPSGLLYPSVVLATVATVIASQAVISSAFSLTRQAIQLGYLPRMLIVHTSKSRMGQVYVPDVNWLLLGGITILILTFKNSGNLAAAYGVAVSGTMLATTILAVSAARRIWGVGWLVAVPIGVVFILIDLSFFGACSLKILQGGWMPLAVGVSIYLMMTTWHIGRRVMSDKVAAESLPLDIFIKDIAAKKPHRIRGTAAFLSANETGVPRTLLHNFKHNQALHESIIFVAVRNEEVPRIPEDERCEVTPLGEGFHRAIIRYGFSEEPDIPRALLQARTDLDFNPQKVTFFLGGVHLLRGKRPSITPWRRKIYIMLSRNALDATHFYKIPVNRVVVMGIQVEV